ncbi:MAG TPA: hypothetical protein VGE52_17280, partial [Pirellulales bacterium]
MFGLVGSLVRWSPVLVVAGVAAVWCAAWKAQPASDSRAATAWQADSRALIERLRSDNPQAAANLEALQKRHPGPGFAAVLNDAYHRNDSAGLAEVARGRKNELLQLLDLAEEQAFTTPAAREQFLVAHGAYHQMLLAAGLRDEAARYLALLKKHQTPLDREAVRDDAVAVLVWDAVSDPDVRAFYLREREWLAPLLAELRLTAIETPGLCGPNGSPDLATVLTAAAAHHPLPKQAAVELQLGSSALQLFVDQGDAIAAAVDRHKLPLDAVLEVVFANSDWLAQRRAEGRTGAEIAHRLAGVAKARPALWAIARRYPFSLRLNED